MPVKEVAFAVIIDSGKGGGHTGASSLPGYFYPDHVRKAVDFATGKVDAREFSEIARSLWDALHPIGKRAIVLTYSSGRKRTFRE